MAVRRMAMRTSTLDAGGPPLQNVTMTAQRTDSPMRALGLAVALFAITLNFLQPLAHAAMMRSGAPETLWTAFCNSTAT